MGYRLLVTGLLAIVVCGGGGNPAGAQTVLVTPSLSLSEEYDDNVNNSPTDPQSDLITVLAPGLRLEVRDHPWYLTATGTVRNEYFAQRSQLNTTFENLQGAATIEYRPSAIFSASITDTYARTVNALEIAPESGLIPGRFVSTSNAITPAVRYQFDPSMSVRGSYTFRTFRSEAPQARGSDTHEVDTALDLQLTRRVSGNLRYVYSRFLVEELPSRDSHSPRVGVVYAYSPTLRVSSDAGALLLEREDGSFDVTFASSTRYDQEFRRGRLSVGYERSSGVAGLVGVPSVTQALTAAGTFQATRQLTLDLAAAATESTAEAVRGPRTTTEAIDLRTYTVWVRASYRLLRWLSLEASYRFRRQDDRVGDRDFDRNVFSLGLTVTDQFRAY